MGHSYGLKSGVTTFGIYSIKQLRADFAKIAGTMRELASNSVAEAEDRVAASADKVWTEAKRHVQTVGREIEERPIASALTAFATGIILG